MSEGYSGNSTLSTVRGGEPKGRLQHPEWQDPSK